MSGSHASPAKAAASGVSSDVAAGKAPARQRAVLVVDDSVPNQMIATAFLFAGGYRTSVASNGEEALEAARNERFDLVLMDIDMPVMDGVEATRRLRGTDDYKRTPILAFTAHALDGDVADLKCAGLDDVLTKPVTRETLLALVGRWIADRPITA